jgi:hypothetical protein
MIVQPAQLLAADCEHVATVAARDELATICRPAINLAIWQRALDRRLTEDCGVLLRHDGDPLQLELPVGEIAKAVPSAMALAGWPAAPHFVDDLAMLAECFAGVTGGTAVALRLDVITNDACRKYHADYVTVRLITTYAGPGSQWLSNADAAALAAGVPARQLVSSNLLAGELALFKGRLLTDSPIIHRSPPITGSGQRRLVLVINPAASEPLP